MTTALYPWEDARLAVAEAATAELEADAEYDAWLTAIREAWLDDALADVEFGAEPTDSLDAYVPFQFVPADWARGNLTDEPGYAESVAPFLY